MLIPIPIPQYGIGIIRSVDVHFWNFLVCFLSRRAKSIGIGRILQNPLESYVFRLQASRPQVGKYGPVSGGKHRKSTERGSSIPVRNFWTFFWRVPINSCSLRQETAGNHLEKNRNNFRLEYCFRFPLISRVFLREPAISPPHSGQKKGVKSNSQMLNQF